MAVEKGLCQHVLDFSCIFVYRWNWPPCLTFSGLLFLGFFFLPFTSWIRHRSLSKLFDSLTDHDFGRSWQDEYQFQQQSTPPAAFLDRRIFHMQW